MASAPVNWNHPRKQIHECWGEQFRNSSALPFSFYHICTDVNPRVQMLEGPPAYNPRSMRNSSSNQENDSFPTVCHHHHFSLFLDFLKYIYSFSNCDRSFIGPGIELAVRYNDNKPSPYSSKSSIDHSMCIALCLVLGI